MKLKKIVMMCEEMESQILRTVEGLRCRGREHILSSERHIKS